MSLQDVSSLKCDKLLTSGQVLPNECVSSLVELAGNPNTSTALTSSIISLLAHLGRNVFLPTKHASLAKGCFVVGIIDFSILCPPAHSACDDESREMLHSSFNLTGILASVIHQYSATPGEPLVLQVHPCIQPRSFTYCFLLDPEISLIKYSSKALILVLIHPMRGDVTNML